VAKHVELASGKRPKAILWTAERVAAWSADYEQRLADARKSGRHVDRFRVWRATPRPSKVMVWTPEQTGRFLDHAARDRLYALYHLVAFTGLRRGEACGLSWTDIDFDDTVLHMTWQLVQLGWEVEGGQPKADSVRDLPLDKANLAVLKTWRRRQNAERLEWGPQWADTGRVFTRENGAELHPAAVTELFERLSYEAGLPPILLHDLRHGAATLTLATGADLKIVQELLGHSSITITADTYTSVLPEVARAAAEAAARLVPRNNPAAAADTADDATAPRRDVPVPFPTIAPEEGDGDPKPRSKEENMQVRPGGPRGTRTHNPRIKSPLLCLLS